MLDLGAGTGELTSALLAAGADVAAVEPDPAMLAELRRALPRVRAVPGSAEEIPLPDGSVDAVLAGNAMHWFDMTVAGPEIARVLAPGGILAGLWNVMDDAVAWVAGLAEVSGDAGDEGGDLVMPEPEREAVLSRIRAFLSTREETAEGEFTLPLLTCVLRARRP